MTVTIGSQTAVPSPGSPIASPWAQDTARKLVHQFASIAARDAWVSPPDGAMAYTQATNQLFVRKDAAWVEIAAIDDADTRYVNVSGDLMTGNLVVGTDPATWEGIQLRSTGSIIGTVVGTAGGGTGGLATANISVTRANSPAADAGGIFAQWRRSAGGVGAASVIGSITVDTGGAAVKYNTTSDERLKNELGDLDDGLAVVDALRPIRFTWLDDTTEIAGFLAHEVAEQVPHAVTGERGAVDDDGNPIFQQLAATDLIPYLVAAVQTLTARIETLEGGAT
jgi:hypothetical protein